MLLHLQIDRDYEGPRPDPVSEEPLWQRPVLEMALDLPRLRSELSASPLQVLRYVMIKSALQADRGLKLASPLQRPRLNAACQIFAEALLAAPLSLAIDTIALLNDPALSLAFAAKEHLVSSFLPRYALRQQRAYPVDCSDLRLLHLLTEANRDPRTLTEKFKLEEI